MTESSELYITPVDWHFRSGDSIHQLGDFIRGYERLFEPFEISPGVVLPAGEYKTTRHKANVAFAQKRPPVRELERWVGGQFWSGSSEDVTARLTYKLPPWFTFTASANQTFASLPQGKFTAPHPYLYLPFCRPPRASPSPTWFNTITRSRNLGWQSRMRWTLKPGNDLFLSFNQGWISEDTGSLRFRTGDTKLAAKFHYTLRY